jgi:hypothetical protein
MEGEERGAHVKGFSGEPIEEVSGSGQGVNPVGRWHGGLKKKGADNIVGGADHAFGLSVLLRGVGAGHAESDAVGKKERTRGGVVKLTPVVALHAFDGAAELGAYMSKKICNGRKSVGLKPKRERPQKMRAVIKNN